MAGGRKSNRVRCCDKDRGTQPRARGETQGVRETDPSAPRAGQARRKESGTGTCSAPTPRARRPTCWACAPGRDGDWNLLRPQSQGPAPHVLGMRASMRRGLEPAPPPVPGPGAPRAGHARQDEMGTGTCSAPSLRARRPTCWAGAPGRDGDWNLLHPQAWLWTGLRAKTQGRCTTHVFSLLSSKRSQGKKHH